MMRVARIVSWLAAGHLVAGALYWTLLQVPESTIWTLALSALLALLILCTVAIVETVAIRSWQAADGRPEGLPLRDEGPDPARSGSALALPSGVRWRRALALPSPARAGVGFVIASLIFFAIYWLTGRADAWWSAHRGEIDAWMMMRTRSARTRWLHTFVEWGIWLVRYPAALSLALGFLGAWMQESLRARPLGWIRDALGWRPLVGITLALLIFIVLPWRYVYWRPEWLPPNWIEAVFVSIKLLAIYVLMNTGWAIVLSAGARLAEQDLTPPSARPAHRPFSS